MLIDTLQLSRYATPIYRCSSGEGVTVKLLKTAAILGAGAAIGAVALTIYARKHVEAFLDSPDDTDKDSALMAGSIVSGAADLRDLAMERVAEARDWVADALNGQRPGPTDEIGFHRRQAAEAAGIELGRTE